MTQDIFLALAIFAFSTVFTPGPNNLMLMSAGANFGVRRSLPHLAGVAYGFPLMILMIGLGVMKLFDVWPVSYDVLRIASVAYILWLAWKIATAQPPKDAPSDAQPLTFVQAAGFQWVNPKAWSMALGAITLYATSRDFSAILWVSATYAVIGTVSALSWTVLGTGVRRLLAKPERLRIFNGIMAALLVLSMIPVLIS